MGQLISKRIVQSRAYYDPDQQPIPSFDYDYTYPTTVYEAVKRSMDDTSTNLSEEIDSIYRLINGKQDIVDPGVPGQLMTWTGVRGSIGSVEIVKSINPEPTVRSHQKVPSERAVGDALDKKVSLSEFNEHSNDNSRHITDIERNRWDSMAPLNTLQAHMGNTSVHITEQERGSWNGKANQSEFEDHIYNTSNPHNVTVHQAGGYTRREIDEMIQNLQETFFNYMNISWDDRIAHAELIEYHPGNWNPNYILEFGDTLPEVPDTTLTYFALKPATDYTLNETQDCIIFIKRPGLNWQEVGFQNMSVGDMVIRFPDTAMYVWVQGRFLKLFTGNSDDDLPSGDGTSDLLWRPAITAEGILTWVRSKETEAPEPMIIKGADGYSPIKGVDYFDGVDGAGVPIGGKSGEILVKLTDDNYDTTWKSMLDALSDLIISGGSLPDGIISWNKISGRPEWYNELGDNEDGFVTQRVITRQFEIVNNNITEILSKIDGPGGVEGIRQDLYDHVNDFTNPHRVTAAQIGAVTTGIFTDHVQNFDNPHNVTAAQIGLGNVNNTADLDKPMSNAVKEALDDLLEKLGGVSDDVDRFNYIASVTWDNTSAKLTFQYKDGSTIDVVIPIADVFNSIYFDDAEKELVIILPDGSENRINIASLIKVYTGSSSNNIQVVVEGDTIRASILPGTVGSLEIAQSVHLRMSPTTTTQPISDKSTRIATTEFVRKQVIDNLISYETDRALSANMGRILNERKADIEDVISIVNDLEGIDVIDNLESTNPLAALSANMGRYLDLTKAPRVHTSPSGTTFGRATINLFGHARAANVDPLMDGTVFRGTDDGDYARADHRHPTDTTRAPIHFPDVAHDQYSFTGEPRSTLPPDDSNDDRIATTEWIRRNAVGCMFGRSSTASAEPIKIVTLESTYMEDPVFLRQIGSTVSVEFTEDDLSESEVFLDVHESGPAKVLYGGKPIVNGMLKANHAHIFSFDGTNWRLLNPRGIHTLPDSDNSNSFVSSEWVRRNIVGVSKGESTTATNDPNKVATLRSTFMDPVVFIRQIGSAVAITFENEDRSGTAALTTLNVNNTGASVVLFGDVPLKKGMIGGGYTHLFIFDGTNWRLINPVPGTGMPDYSIGPSPDIDESAALLVTNKMAGHTGMTMQGSGTIDENGDVNHAWINVNFSPRSTDVLVTLSESKDAWALKMGDGTQIKATDPVVIETTRTGCVVDFTMEKYYPSNSPCQLVYYTNKAWINISEL